MSTKMSDSSVVTIKHVKIESCPAGFAVEVELYEHHVLDYAKTVHIRLVRPTFDAAMLAVRARLAEVTWVEL